MGTRQIHSVAGECLPCRFKLEHHAWHVGWDRALLFACTGTMDVGVGPSHAARTREERGAAFAVGVLHRFPPPVHRLTRAGDLPDPRPGRSGAFNTLLPFLQAWPLLLPASDQGIQAKDGAALDTDARQRPQAAPSQWKWRTAPQLSQKCAWPSVLPNGDQHVSCDCAKCIGLGCLDRMQDEVKAILRRSVALFVSRDET